MLDKIKILEDPASVFEGTVLIAAPHMDDEVLACGGTLAMLPQKENLHVVYATDGMKSPAPIFPWRDSITKDLGRRRMNESKAALGVLGIPESNAHFLGLPEANLQNHLPSLQAQMVELIERIKPDHILLPFRYDRHPDHLALYNVISIAQQQGVCDQASLFEYFVYYRWRLLPGRDVRRFIKPQYLLKVDTKPESIRKRKALDCFETQTTIYYSWQTRPILTSILLDRVSHTPELFLRHDPAVSGDSVFSRAVIWIRIVHRLEPFLQKSKYLLGAYLKRGLKLNEPSVT